jgi:hypothetical protein
VHLMDEGSATPTSWTGWCPRRCGPRMPSPPPPPDFWQTRDSSGWNRPLKGWLWRRLPIARASQTGRSFPGRDGELLRMPGASGWLSVVPQWAEAEEPNPQVQPDLAWSAFAKLPDGTTGSRRSVR